MNDEIQELQALNGESFLRLLERSPSFLPLAEQIDDLRNVPNGQSPTRVVKLIEQVKASSFEMEEELSVLISRTGSGESDPDKRMEERNAALSLAYGGNPLSVVTSLSFQYWKSDPKELSELALYHLGLMAKEIRLMDKDLDKLRHYVNEALQEPRLKEDSYRMSGYAIMNENEFLKTILVHLKKIAVISDNYQTALYS
ncbi:hypothetical protein [Cohnella sp. AR92]|uniref:hypothetical protein n=1 Tax=Cohnella sp. AR92 TaxID=648716 RepID=UPI000F8EFCEE|nr:hypothetical protein [Cohnella sp. AR92]RUS45439.1 hypothetical protein ELR57_18940 [Cohnella sp. AR92]